MKSFKVIFLLMFAPLQFAAAEMIVPAPPVIKVSSYIVMDFNSGNILL
jgi:D-alanyl-D-alanine carboxypeptidase